MGFMDDLVRKICNFVFSPVRVVMLLPGGYNPQGSGYERETRDFRIFKVCIVARGTCRRFRALLPIQDVRALVLPEMHEIRYDFL